jgi:hypothetical protein
LRTQAHFEHFPRCTAVDFLKVIHNGGPVSSPAVDHPHLTGEASAAQPATCGASGHQGYDVHRILINSLGTQLAANAEQRIDQLLRDPKGLPNGKGKRTRLSPTKARKFKSALVDAVGHASVWASHAPLPNRVQGRGRPPDNAVFIFINDIVRACKKAGLKPGFRFVAGSESLPVRIFIELAPLLWGPIKAPRRQFERWERLHPTLAYE